MYDSLRAKASVSQKPDDDASELWASLRIVSVSLLGAFRLAHNFPCAQDGGWDVFLQSFEQLLQRKEPLTTFEKNCLVAIFSHGNPGTAKKTFSGQF